MDLLALHFLPRVQLMLIISLLAPPPPPPLLLLLPLMVTGCGAATATLPLTPAPSPIPPKDNVHQDSSSGGVVTVPAAGSLGLGRRRPNFIVLIADDQDLLSGGFSMGPNHPLPHHVPALRARGTIVPHWFTHVPVCCPSRATLLTGRYFHNLQRKPTDRWDTDGHGHPEQCMHINETLLSPGPTIAEPLAAAGYSVAFFGKYLNISPNITPSGAKLYFVNPGPASHSAKDRSGEYYPSWWYNGTQPGTAPGRWNNTNMEYETDLIMRTATAWIADALTSSSSSSSTISSSSSTTTTTATKESAPPPPASPESAPFFAYIAPHAPHGSAIPAPRYADRFRGMTAPRPPSFNYSARDHHWLVAQQSPTRADEVARSDAHFANRWACLLSVDDLVGSLMAVVEDHNATDNTFFFLSSDHGFHFHTLRLGMGKWNAYDSDLRVPMLVAGPGIGAGVTLPQVVGSHVDLAPTLLELAGIEEKPTWMDGRSIARQLLAVSENGEEGGGGRDNPLPPTPASTSAGKRGEKGGGTVPKLLRDHDGHAAAASTSASSTTTITSTTTGTLRRPANLAYVEYHGLGPVGAPARQMDAFNNTFRGIRVVGGVNDNMAIGLTAAAATEETHSHATTTTTTNANANTAAAAAATLFSQGNFLYAEWGENYLFEGPNLQFIELFDLDADPWQMHNLHPEYQRNHPDQLAAMANLTHHLWLCKGDGCV